jgi:hypothetical protein
MLAGKGVLTTTAAYALIALADAAWVVAAPPASMAETLRRAPVTAALHLRVCTSCK